MPSELLQFETGCFELTELVLSFTLKRIEKEFLGKAQKRAEGIFERAFNGSLKMPVQKY